MRRNKQENNVVQKCNTPVKQKRAISPIHIVLTVLVCLAIALVLVLVLPDNDTAHLLTFTSKGDGTCYVSDIGTCTDTELVIPSVSPAGDRVTEIRPYAFEHNISLTSVTIPASITTIGKEAFVGCSSLTEITVDGANQSYQSINGNLYTKDGKTLIQYAIGKTEKHFEIPASVTTIGDYAFYKCTSLTSVTISDSVTTVGYNAFLGCNALAMITIPGTLESIGHGAFWGCDSLKDVYYAGSENQWRSIWIDSANTLLTSATIHYGTPVTTVPPVTTTPPMPDTPAPSYSQGLAYTSNGDGTCYVSGIGDCTDTHIVIPSLSPAGDTVTGIGGSAFYECTSLTSIAIPEGVTAIGGFVFYYCTSLTEIAVDSENQFYQSIDGNLYSKDGKTLLQYAFGKTATCFEVPEGVTTIGGYAFSGCRSLTSITIPEGVTTIGSYAFSGCTSLTSIAFAEGSQLATIGYAAFNYCTSLTSVTIPEGVTTIGDYAFEHCASLTSVAIPATVTSIGNDAFYYCTSLTEIIIPASVSSIGEWAFYGCESLTIYCALLSQPSGWDSSWNPDGRPVKWASQGLAYTSNGDGTCYVSGIGTCTDTEIVIPSLSPDGDRVTTIGWDAFGGCTSLTEIAIPASVTTIAPYAFGYCTSLTSITIPDSVTTIGERAFWNCTALTSVTFAEGSQLTSIGYWAFGYCTSLTSITIPDSVTTIGSAAFGGCTSLTEITIPEGVTTIGEEAFSGCTALTSIVIPGTVTTIGDGAFYYCTSLTEIIIPDSVTTIGYWAFRDCTSLTSIIIPASVTTIGQRAFAYCTSLTEIIIPATVTYIGYDAFRDCTSLTDVYYTGSKAAWQSISIGSDNIPLTSATIHYNYNQNSK